MPDSIPLVKYRNFWDVVEAEHEKVQAHKRGQELDERVRRRIDARLRLRDSTLPEYQTGKSGARSPGRLRVEADLDNVMRMCETHKMDDIVLKYGINRTVLEGVLRAERRRRAGVGE